MSRVVPMAAVLFVDIAGSSRLTAEVGDLEAGRRIRALLQALANIVVHHRGQVLKSDGDDLIAWFDNGDESTGNAANAAIDAMFAADEAALALYAGIASGPVEVTEVLGREDLAGRTVILAARLHKLIENVPGFIFLDAECAARLPEALAARCSGYGVRSIKGLGELPVMSLGWRGPGGTTAHAGGSFLPTAATLVLGVDGRDRAFDASLSPIAIGRALPNEGRMERIVCLAPGVSSWHASIVCEGAAWQLRDRSRFGTWLRIGDSGDGIKVAGQVVPLMSEGALCLGRPFAQDRDRLATITFRVEALC